MSRVGKYPVVVPAGVTVSINGQTVHAKGKFGELSFDVVDDVEAKLEDGKIWVAPRSEDKFARSMWGTCRSRIHNLVKGVGEGFTKRLDIVGVGYRAQVQGSTLKLALGFSHDVDFPIPVG
ncbi:MAG: 50S ribosomal protein L6, partial [Rhodospirillaceae bacterium]|nr:50S ribosomal protein L6 [Rhodospirillaceae bacterium]